MDQLQDILVKIIGIKLPILNAYLVKNIKNA